MRWIIRIAGFIAVIVVLGLHFLQFIRPQQRFENVDALIAQIRQDVGVVRDQSDALKRLRAAGLIPLPPVASS